MPAFSTRIVIAGAAKRKITSNRGRGSRQWQDARQLRQAPTAVTERTFGEAYATYLTNHLGEWGDRQRFQIGRLFANHTEPLDSIAVNAITPDMVADVLRPLWRGPAAGAGARLRQLMEHVFRSAGVKGDDNPAMWDCLRDLLSKKTIKATPHPSMAYADLPAFMVELGDDAVARCLRFCILTATRSAEAIGAAWSEIDLAKREWTIPAARMKMDLEHIIR